MNQQDLRTTHWKKCWRITSIHRPTCSVKLSLTLNGSCSREFLPRHGSGNIIHCQIWLRNGGSSMATLIMYLLTTKQRIISKRRAKRLQKIWAKANSDRMLATHRKWHLKVYYLWRSFVDALKSTPCADCKLKYPPYMMEFDHVRGIKLFNISESQRRCYDDIIKEVKKCDVVCSNCHKARTHDRQQGWKREVWPD